MGVTSIEGFLLTRQWQESDRGLSLVFWLQTDAGPLRVEVADAEAVFFVAAANQQQVSRALGSRLRYREQPVELQTFHLKAPVMACYFASQRDANIARGRLEDAGVTVYEGDVRPTDRYLMERFIRGAAKLEGVIETHDGFVAMTNPRWSPADFLPDLLTLSVDIETSMTRGEVLSIAASGADALAQVFMVGQASEPVPGVIFCRDESNLIRSFLEWIAEVDPDVIIGWSVVAFDLDFLARRCEALGIAFTLGRNRQAVQWRETAQGRKFAKVPGRVVLDGIELLRTATYSFESFSLENVARELLGRGKHIDDVDHRAHHIETMFEDDKAALAAYNLEDCRLVFDIFVHTDLLAFAMQRARLTGLEMDRAGGSVAAFDYLYLPRLHREGLVAPVVAEAEQEGSPGGFVMNSRAGLYEDILVLDFKSLYPSIIRTFHVDPLALTVALDDDTAIPGFKGGRFSRERYILPGLIDELWQAREAAKRTGDSANSQAIKIIMNSFYGVLGTTGCRFFDSRLASSITMRGHEILQRTRELIEAKGYPVIYGDTDSVFVHINNSNDDPATTGRALADDLNDWWRQQLSTDPGVESYLEIEFETHYRHFFMPTVRGSEAGSKKRYAGMIAVDGELQMVFKGLETVRTDWSPLARDFQRELYRRVFLGEPFADFVREEVSAVMAGERDSQLVLRRRLRRQLADYTRQVPPHVRAARIEAEHARTQQEDSWMLSGSRWVEYVMTVNGAEPVRFLSSAVDYQFYVDRQLAPIADAILQFRGETLASLTDRQLGLF